jgi:hypothetical protein
MTSVKNFEVVVKLFVHKCSKETFSLTVRNTLNSLCYNLYQGESECVWKGKGETGVGCDAHGLDRTSDFLTATSTK